MILAKLLRVGKHFVAQFEPHRECRRLRILPVIGDLKEQKSEVGVRGSWGGKLKAVVVSAENLIVEVGNQRTTKPSGIPRSTTRRIPQFAALTARPRYRTSIALFQS